MMQQSLLEKQRQTEQDRGLMLTAIEAERSKLSSMRVERIKLCEERSAIEREMADIQQERWLSAHQPGKVGGVRGAGVPSGREFHSAPAEQQRLRGVRQEADPPMAFSTSDGFDDFGTDAEGRGGGSLSEFLRHTGDGYSLSYAYRAQAAAPDRDRLSDNAGMQRKDRRGVRNEGGGGSTSLVGDQKSGFGDEFGESGRRGAVNTRSHYTAPFGV